MAPKAIVAWLLAGDPAIAWQTERDLLSLPAGRYERTRLRVAEAGWGARLLSRRAGDGSWGGGAYTPKWTSTFYTLQLLALLGVGGEQRECVASCRSLLDQGVQESGSVRLWKSAPADTCVTAMLLATSCAFGLHGDERARRMVRWLLDQQMRDGGWNCRWQRASAPPTHASFHTTTSVLEALHAWRSHAPSPPPQVERASAAGRDFMLEHHLYRSHRTGKIARAELTQLSFPHWWKFDVLRGLDHFRQADAWDERLADPLELLLRRRGADGRWRLPRQHPGRVWFRMETTGQPSRWNTLRALRVLDWASRAKR